MAEFVDVISEIRRMCSSYNLCEECDFKTKHICKTFIQCTSVEDAKEIEEKVMNWAKQHPKPQYPTWGEWFEAQGELMAEWRNVRVVSNVGTGVIGVLYQRIPADIAEKLGIEPKEEKNNG